MFINLFIGVLPSSSSPRRWHSWINVKRRAHRASNDISCLSGHCTVSDSGCKTRAGWGLVRLWRLRLLRVSSSRLFLSARLFYRPYDEPRFVAYGGVYSPLLCCWGPWGWRPRPGWGWRGVGWRPGTRIIHSRNTMAAEVGISRHHI